MDPGFMMPGIAITRRFTRQNKYGGARERRILVTTGNITAMFFAMHPNDFGGVTRWTMAPK
jgi:hypothetical protein